MRVGDYEIVRKIGEGAYGRVYLARKEGLGGFRSWYALKRLRPEHRDDPVFRSYLMREAMLGGLVQHPALVRIHEVVTAGDEVVLVMDWVDGVSLRDVLNRLRSEGRGLPLDVTLELAAALLEALDHVHTLVDPEGSERAFVHRDVKPGNVMLTRDGSVKLMDFGVARGDGHHQSTLQGELRGTLAYMAPEQAAGAEAGPAADQFALGLLLLECLIGTSPWGDPRTPGLLARVVAGDVREGLARVDANLPILSVLERMLQREPEHRFPDCAEAARALRTLRAAAATPPALADWAKEQVRSRKRSADDAPSWTKDKGGGSTGVVERSGGSTGSAGISGSGGVGTSGGSFGSGGDGRWSGSWSGTWTQDAAPAVLRAKGQGLLDTPVDGTMPFGQRGALAREVSRDESALAAAPRPSDPEAPAGDHERTILLGRGATQDAPGPLPSTVPPGPVPAARSPAPPASAQMGAQPLEAPTPTEAQAPTASVEAPLPTWAPPTTSEGRAANRRTESAPPAEARARPAPGTAGTLLGSPLLTLIGGLTVVAAFAVALALATREPVVEGEAVAELDADLAERASRPRAPTPAPLAVVPTAVATAPTPPTIEAPPLPSPSVEAPPPLKVMDQSSPPLWATALGPSRDPMPPPSFVRPSATDAAPTRADNPTARNDQSPAPPKAQPPAGPKPGDVLNPRNTEPTPEPATPEAPKDLPPSLKFVSGREHPLGAPLGVRVRPQSFLPSAVSGWYQWRDEGGSGRRKRSLSAQSDGSFLLDIPASELRADRLQLWFVAEPQGVTLGSAADPIEVRVR